jgi:adhesin transport system outer membrane protein
LGASALIPASASAGSLVEELNGLLLSHPQIEGAREDVAAAEEGVNKAFGDFLPKAELSSSFGYEHVDSPARRSFPFNGKEFETGHATQATVTVTQTLFDGFRNDAAYDGAKAQHGASQAQLESGTQAIMLEGIKAYLEVLRNIRLVDLAYNSETNIMSQLNLEDERVRRGSGIAVDVLQAKSRLQVAKERRVAFEGALRESMSRYEQVFGSPAVVEEMTMPTPPVALVPESLDDAVKAALAEHPSILAAVKLIDVADNSRIAAKSPFYPRIDLVGTWNFENEYDGVSGERRDYTAKIRANWELFNGFATRAAASQASHQYLSTIDQANYTRRKVAEETRLSWQALETARDRVALLQNGVNIASEVYEARRKLRAAGKDTAINVLDSENEVFDARINLVAAQHDARLATYRLLTSMGRMTIPNVAAGAQGVAPETDGAS